MNGEVGHLAMDCRSGHSGYASQSCPEGNQTSQSAKESDRFADDECLWLTSVASASALQRACPVLTPT